MKIAAKFKDLKEVKNLFPKDFPVLGVGVTAWPRSALAYLLPNLTILSYLETSDLGSIRQVCPVISMEKDLGGLRVEKENTSSMLEVLVQSMPALIKDRQGLFVYKGTIRIDKIVAELGWRLMSTAGAIRNPLENKRIFREHLVKAGIQPVKGITLKVKELDENAWKGLKKRFGEKLVFQLADSVNGGGAGTFFVFNKNNFDSYREAVKEKEIRQDKDLEWVNVTQFIEGETASIIGCATKHGVVLGRLQKQIIDQPELGEIKGRSGVWHGHDWTISFNPEAQIEAEKLAKTWGEYIYQLGYKGVFGLDVMVTRNNQVYPIECNSRYTGAFPVLTMLQLKAGLMPFDVWHLAEWLDLDYELDVEKVSKLYQEPLVGSQLVMHSLEAGGVKINKEMKAGVYKFSFSRADMRRARLSPAAYVTSSTRRSVSRCAEISYIRPGFSLLDLQDKNEFILVDRVMRKESVVKPGFRLGRLVFNQRLIGDKGRLLPEIRSVVKAVYEGFGLEKVN